MAWQHAKPTPDADELDERAAVPFPAQPKKALTGCGQQTHERHYTTTLLQMA
jgi:hypothetical protein